jgi:hypothetical protein
VGAIVFDGISVAVMFGAERWGHGVAGEIGPDIFLTLGFFVSGPAMYLADHAGVPLSDTTSFMHSATFGLVVNGLLGAAVFSAAIFLWKILRKF